MFRRTFWFTAGAAAGVWATAKVNRKLKQLTPESLAAQAADKAIETGHKLKDFALDVREGMVRREAELGGALGLEAPVDPDLVAQRHYAVEAAEPPANTNAYRKLPYNANHDNANNRNEDH
ncbi:MULTISPECIES: DUF6167 family protein [unclassified Streptomyces]|uniref:DUF6167 family protein n=1 Tax=unclassified Streptomyces TaxID=2593676 RepID=UPI0037BC2E1D